MSIKYLLPILQIYDDLRLIIIWNIDKKTNWWFETEGQTNEKKTKRIESNNEKMSGQR